MVLTQSLKDQAVRAGPPGSPQSRPAVPPATGAQLPKRRFPSESSQTKIPTERSKAKVPKRHFPSESFKATDSKRKFPSERCQAKVHKRRIPHESSQAKDPKRKFPSKRSQAKDPKPKTSTNILKKSSWGHAGIMFPTRLFHHGCHEHLCLHVCGRTLRVHI